VPVSKIYSYVVEHDVGFAPNPFWGVCTLANCKPDIRRMVSVGDRIVGTGSASVRLQGHLTFWMKVDEIISFDEYWNEPRFGVKRPVLNGSKMQQYGDNIYHTDPSGRVRQLDSFHSEPNGVLSVENLTRDTGKTSRVLIGAEFVYFGGNAPRIPPELGFVIKKGPGHKCNFTAHERALVEAWLHQMGDKRLQGEPARWRVGR
jgi:hypothetical protein